MGTLCGAGRIRTAPLLLQMPEADGEAQEKQGEDEEQDLLLVVGQLEPGLEDPAESSRVVG